MGVVTGGGGGGGTPFNGGTITEGLAIADPDAAETQLTITGTGSTVGAKLIDASAVHTLFTVDSDGSVTASSDDTLQVLLRGTADSGSGLAIQNGNTFAAVNLTALSTRADLFVQDSGVVSRAGLSTLFGLMTARNTVPNSNDLDAGQCALWFDQTNGSSKLMIKGKSADGTVVTGSVALV